jgi:hypothetical protein
MVEPTDGGEPAYRLVREPDEAEKVPQAYLLARKAPET